MPSNLLGPRDATENKTYKKPWPHQVYILVREKQINNASKAYRMLNSDKD